ncbi:hypothetical protein [Spirulina major]|uniref:hypothetical protein n=1 Tax=Spirulina major TaxID=270636 RepID=UPI0009338291|nr:hypothetical protein [Spirulina major]
MATPDPFYEQPRQRLQLFFTLVPVLGSLPALWFLIHPQSSPQQKATSRLALLLLGLWIGASAVTGLGIAQAADTVFRFRLLFFDGTLTSLYVLTCVGLMVRVWQRRSLRIPGLSPAAQRLFKYPSDHSTNSR